MGKVSVEVSISVDGFMACENNDPGSLHNWIFAGSSPGGPVEFSPEGVNKQVFKEMWARVGAVVVGRRTFDAGEEPWGPVPPFQVPLFVVTHRPRETVRFEETSYTFVTDGLPAALARARAAAGEKDVAVMGGTLVRQCLAAGELDEMELHLVPVLLGKGIPLFEAGSLGEIDLEQTRLIEGRGVTHMRFTVKR